MLTLSPIRRELALGGFLGISYFEFGKNFYHPPEKHDWWEMVYVDRGEIVAVTDGAGRPLGCGQVVFHEPGEVHAHISNHVVSNNMLVISFAADGEAMRLFSKKTFSLGKTEKTLLTLFTDEAKSALGRIPDDYNAPAPLCFDGAPFGSLQLLDCLFTEFLIRLARRGDETSGGAGTETPRAPKEGETERIEAFMREKLYSDLTLGELCAHFYLGKSYLSELFKMDRGKSPMRYYASLKLAEAKRLLRESDFTVSQIAEILGYGSVFSFSRAFRSAAGLSPREYKKRIL